MKVTVISILVDDQQKALQFYTGVLGFLKKRDIPMGEHAWLTVVSKEAPDGVEVLLEPMAFAPARIYQKALFDAGIPLTFFQADNIDNEYKRLLEAGVVFSMPPTIMGPNKLAVFNDTCGNHIQLVEIL